MRYLDALLESLETTGPVRKSKPNNFKLLKTLVDRGKSADKAGDKLDNKYKRRHTKTGRGASDDKQQDQTLNKLSATGKEAEKSFTQADKLVPKVHLKGGGKGDGKPRGKLRLVQGMAYQQIGDIIAEITYNRRDARILRGRALKQTAQQLKNAADKAIKSREDRDKLAPNPEHWENKIKAEKVLGDVKNNVNVRRETTREKSQ